MSYTKGVWKAVETEDGWVVKLIEKGWQIGECFICQEVCQGEDDGEADAKLIAAAPELLEALKIAIGIIRHEMVPVHNHTDPLAIDDCLKTMDEAVMNATV